MALLSSAISPDYLAHTHFGNTVLNPKGTGTRAEEVRVAGVWCGWGQHGGRQGAAMH